MASRASDFLKAYEPEQQRSAVDFLAQYNPADSLRSRLLAGADVASDEENALYFSDPTNDFKWGETQRVGDSPGDRPRWNPNGRCSRRWT